MTYTKQVREYCENHKGTLIDVSKVKYMFDMFKESGITNIPKWYK